MLQRILAIVILVPLAILVIALVVANRAPVSFGLDPFAPDNPALSFQLPLFVLLFLTLLLGMIVGSIATWARQAPYRKIARRHRADAPADAASGHALARPRA